MKNKKFKSLNKQFLIVNIVSLVIAIILVITFIGYSALKQEIANSPIYLLNKSNELYVKISQDITRNDEKNSAYLKKLGRYYKLNIAITDIDGNIMMKSENVKEDKVDLKYVDKILKGKALSREDIYQKHQFYQRHSIIIDNKSYEVFIWTDSDAVSPDRGNLVLGICLIIMVITIVLIYLFTNRKVKYINQISKGVDEFSKGNLDYSIKEKGHDELYSLAKNSNTMAQNLKAMIEEEKRVQKLKTELITNVSHDLRTPLTSLIGYLQLLNNENIKEEEKEKYASISLEKAKNLGGLIEDLFNYSKLESGGIVLEKIDVNIIEILEQTIGEASFELDAKKIKIEKNFESNSIIANVDPMQIGRVFQNLLNNAVKYGIEETGIKVLAFKNENKVCVSFENMTDNIIKDDANLLFERFYRGDASRNSRIKGSGLGLAIAKSIVSLHEGIIKAEFKDSRFKIIVEL